MTRSDRKAGRPKPLPSHEAHTCIVRKFEAIDASLSSVAPPARTAFMEEIAAMIAAGSPLNGLDRRLAANGVPNDRRAAILGTVRNALAIANRAHQKQRRPHAD